MRRDAYLERLGMRVCYSAAATQREANPPRAASNGLFFENPPQRWGPGLAEAR